ncbi:GPW/gp25 family protein [Chitinophaga filiformis]|uniref:GPW/gp25 family protein n=1 Tax=Chitinophaga filiformis TaxID=104663 RepID=UPI001F22DC7D|nr:GPW/gp25 family protein [Chitinophaga filiformis]MCF6407764.1 GPW/gp25 family protein [Chitinophaga filiformis]
MKEHICSIRYPFAIDQGLGTLMEEHNYDQHVKQLMLQVLFTNPGERINRPDFGCGIRRMVFAPNSEVSANLTKVAVTQALEKWMADLVSVVDVKVTSVNEKLEVGIVYILKARQERHYLNLEVTL